MSHTRPDFDELLAAYFGPYDDSYGESDSYVVEESDYGDGYVFAYDDGDGVIYHEPESKSSGKLRNHVGHSVGIDHEGDDDDPDWLAIICFDCDDEIIYELDKYSD